MNKCFCGRDRLPNMILCQPCADKEDSYNREFPKCEECGQDSWHGSLCDMCLYGDKNMSEKKEQVDHPKHYNTGKFEVIDVIEDWEVDFHIGNVIKYVSRAGRKADDTEIQDLKKALWYLKRKIELLEKKDV